MVKYVTYIILLSSCSSLFISYIIDNKFKFNRLLLSIAYLALERFFARSRWRNIKKILSHSDYGMFVRDCLNHLLPCIGYYRNE